MDTFKDYLGIEVARIRRYKLYTSCLCLLNIENLDTVYLELGLKSKPFFVELSEIIGAVLRTSDIITSFSDSVFPILLTETPVEGGKVAMNRLRTSVGELFSHNLGKQASIHTVVVGIDGIRDANTIFDEVIRDGMVR
jgi:GGDEF domain-containing protein